MLKNHHLAKHIQDHAWGKLIQFTQGKAAKAGKSVELVNANLPGGEPSQLTLWMAKGGRPPGAIEAKVSVYVEGQLAGTADVTSPEPQPFAFSLPLDAGGRAFRRDGFVVVRLETPTWNPHDVLGTTDDRKLGVMVTRVELR